MNQTRMIISYFFVLTHLYNRVIYFVPKPDSLILYYIVKLNIKRKRERKNKI